MGCRRTGAVIPVVSGVYRVTNTVNGKVYIGSSIDCWSRWATHQREIRRGTHPSGHLVYAWRKYGAASFKFDIVEFVDPDNLLAAEQRWIDETGCTSRTKGYNTKPLAGRTSGFRHSEATKAILSERGLGKKMSAEQREKMRVYMLGRGKTASHAANISLGQMSFTGQRLHELLSLRTDGMGVVALAARFGVCRSTIRRTLNGIQTGVRGKVVDPIAAYRPDGKFKPGVKNLNGNRFTASQVNAMYWRWFGGLSPEKIAAEFTCSTSTVYRIFKGQWISYGDCRAII